MSIRLFEGTAHAQLYSRYRPTYPESVFQEVLKFLEEKVPENQWKIAVDVGCGSGQATNVVAKYFQTCYGFDVSSAQIKEAKDNKQSDNIFYEVSPAESLNTIESNSVQLVTAFAAAHWFDLEKFFKETDRILVDNGLVAFICYHMPGPDPINPEAPDDKRLVKLMEDKWFDKRLAPFKDPRNRVDENHYRDVNYPANYEFKHIEYIIDSKTVSAEFLVGFYKSWSLYQGLLAKDNQLAEHCLQEFIDELKSILNVNDLSEKQIRIEFKHFIALFRKMKN